MARHEYVEYILTNPIITSWNHNRLDYADTKTREFDMKIAYEAVSYNVGAVDPAIDPAGGVEGFGDTHYDHGMSPQQGINPDPTVIDPSFVQSLDLQGASGSILASVINQVASAQNTVSPINASGTSGILTSPSGTNAGGLSGIAFPQSNTATNTGTAASTSGITA